MSSPFSSGIITKLLAIITVFLLIIGILGGYIKQDVAKGVAVIPKEGMAAIPEELGFKMLKKMGRGVNILGYDGIWDSPAFNPFKPHYFSMIRKAGFQHVRINLHAFEFMDDAHRLAPRFFTRLDYIIKLAITAGLVPVIDEHNVETCQKDPDLCAIRLQAFWRQISEHYQNLYPSLVFELLNEPGGNMSKQMWNNLLSKVLGIIRATSSARTVIIAAINDGDPRMAQHLKLPETDRNIIVTVHYYKPFNFTHQGASWSGLGNKTGVRWGTKVQKEAIAKDFRIINEWARTNRRPIYLGEFGVYEKADSVSRTNWMSFITREAERLGWGWAYWQFDHDFKLFDTEKQRWERDILNAIMDRD